MIDTPITHEEVNRFLQPVVFTIAVSSALYLGFWVLYWLWRAISYPFRPLPDRRTHRRLTSRRLK